jgi:hypothetical protein
LNSQRSPCLYLLGIGIKSPILPGMVAHAFNPSTREAKAGGFLSSRTTRVTQRNPVLKKKQQKKNQNKTKKKAYTTSADDG